MRVTIHDTIENLWADFRVLLLLSDHTYLSVGNLLAWALMVTSLAPLYLPVAFCVKSCSVYIGRISRSQLQHNSHASLDLALENKVTAVSLSCSSFSGPRSSSSTNASAWPWAHFLKWSSHHAHPHSFPPISPATPAATHSVSRHCSYPLERRSTPAENHC